MREELLKAVQTGRTWLDRFTRREYTKAFKAYTEQFGPVYMAAVRETNGDETALRALADSLLDGLENGWKRQRIWNRSAVKVNEKQMMVDYLSPMLLARRSRIAPGSPISCGTGGRNAGPGTPIIWPPIPKFRTASGM